MEAARLLQGSLLISGCRLAGHGCLSAPERVHHGLFRQFLRKAFEDPTQPERKFARERNHFPFGVDAAVGLLETPVPIEAPDYSGVVTVRLLVRAGVF